MRSLDGHAYDLDNMDPGTGTQPLQFVRKEPVEQDGTRVFRTVTQGTSNEEVLRALIDRLNRLNARMSCPDNHDALAHLHLAMAALERRSADRRGRGVANTPRP